MSFKDELILQRTAVAQSWRRFQDNKNREWGLYGHDTGHHDLNMAIGGWIPSKVTVIAGRSGASKTALTTQMFQSGGRVFNGRRAEYLFFTWEMDSSYLVDRHICNRVGVTNRLLTQGAKLLEPPQIKRIDAAYKEAANLPVSYQQTSTNIRKVRAMVTEFVAECKKKEKAEGLYIQPVVIVDYIGMAEFEGTGLRTYGIAEFMNGMKELANRVGAAVCLIAQINRGADDKAVPQRSDLSDSQSIEMSTDNLILIHRPEYNGIHTITDPDTGEDIDSKNKMLMRTLKGRDFGTGDALVNCDVKFFRFWNRDHEYGVPYWEMYKDKNFWINQLKNDR